MSTDSTPVQTVQSAEPAEILHPQGTTRLQPTAKMVGVHSMTLRRWWANGKFPKPIKVNGLPMFRNAELLAWLEDQRGAGEVEGA